MENEAVILQFTVSDRDMLKGTHRGVEQILAKMDQMSSRLSVLEQERDEARGALRALKFLWVAVLGLLGLFGWHIKAH